MFGKLTVDALPLYSWVAVGGALVTVVAGLAILAIITQQRRWIYLWTEWFTSVDHKRIGIMYIILAMVMLIRGFVDAIMMRAQQAFALNSDGYLPPEHFGPIVAAPAAAHRAALLARRTAMIVFYCGAQY